jgi:CxxC motif-containing protein (DUF1111 family)
MFKMRKPCDNCPFRKGQGANPQQCVGVMSMLHRAEHAGVGASTPLKGADYQPLACTTGIAAAAITASPASFG